MAFFNIKQKAEEQAAQQVGSQMQPLQGSPSPVARLPFDLSQMKGDMQKLPQGMQIPSGIEPTPMNRPEFDMSLLEQFSPQDKQDIGKYAGVALKRMYGGQ